jgi:hypothetical protein
MKKIRKESMGPPRKLSIINIYLIIKFDNYQYKNDTFLFLYFSVFLFLH